MPWSAHLMQEAKVAGNSVEGKGNAGGSDTGSAGWGLAGPPSAAGLPGDADGASGWGLKGPPKRSTAKESVDAVGTLQVCPGVSTSLPPHDVPGGTESQSK